MLCWNGLGSSLGGRGFSWTGGGRRGYFAARGDPESLCGVFRPAPPAKEMVTTIMATTIQPPGGTRGPSQEYMLLDYLQRMGRNLEGRRAVHIHLSRLRPQNR